MRMIRTRTGAPEAGVGSTAGNHAGFRVLGDRLLELLPDGLRDCPYHRIWLSVIHQAAWDGFASVGCWRGLRAETMAARAWFDGPDFLHVCDLVNVERHDVMKLVDAFAAAMAATADRRAWMRSRRLDARDAALAARRARGDAPVRRKPAPTTRNPPPQREAHP